MPDLTLNKSDWPRAMAIFETASETPADTREAWLDAACQGNPELYSKVQALLQAQEEEERYGFLERQIASYAGRLAAGAAPARIGQYRVLSEIARGGMGAVFLAERDDGQYATKVAIKLVHTGSSSNNELKSRFLTERQILASLRHAHIAQLLDGGITEDGVPYLVMEYVKGSRLDEYCRRNDTPLRHKIDLFRHVCSAVQFAHRNLIVHRDIKPSNILVDGNGSPKLLDFGIAKLLQPTEMMHTVAMTQPAQRLMTLEYASPEQFRGEPVSTATDIYSLGIVLYELLAGRHPFAQQRSDFLGLQHAVCEIDPPPPSAAAEIEPAVSGLAGDLDHIVLKAIRKEPAARYDSVEQLSEDLGRYLDGYPVIATQGKTRYRIGKFVSRHRWGVLSAAAFAVLLVSFSIGAMLLAARVTRERNEAQQQREIARKVSAFLDSLFQSTDPNKNAGQALAAKGILDQGAARVAKELAGEPRVQVDLLETIGQAYKHLGLYDKADEIFRQKVTAVDRAYGPGSEEKGRILRQLGDTERQRGNLAGAERDLRQSLAILEKLPPDRNAQLSHALNNMALVLQAKQDLPAAEADFRRAVAISQKYPAEIAETLTMRSNLALLLMDHGRNDEAEPIFRDVLARRRKVLGDNHPQVATSMRHLATALAHRGQLQEADALYRQVLARYAADYPPDHPQIIQAVVLLAATLRDEGQFAHAEEFYRQALSSDERTVGEHGNTAVHASALAYVLFLQGRDRDAHQLLERGLTVIRADGNAGTIREARILTQLATVETATNRFDAASGNLQQALQICGKFANSSQAESAAAWFQLAELKQSQGLDRDADELYLKAIAIDRALGSEAAFPLAAHLLGYAAFLARQTRAEQATTFAREAVALRKRILSDDSWQIDAADSVLAASLIVGNRDTEAEPLAAAAEANLVRKLGPESRPSMAAAANLAQGYRLSGRPAPKGMPTTLRNGRNLLCCAY